MSTPWLTTTTKSVHLAIPILVGQKNLTSCRSSSNVVVGFDSLDRHDCGRPLVPSRRGRGQGHRHPHPAGERRRRLVFDCPFCDRRFPQRAPLEMHLCNGWCKKMDFGEGNATGPRDVAKLYKVLTGLELPPAAAAGGEDLSSDPDGAEKPGSASASAAKEQPAGKLAAAANPAVSSAFAVSDRNFILRYGSIQSGEVTYFLLLGEGEGGELLANVVVASKASLLSTRNTNKREKDVRFWNNSENIC